MKKYFYILLLSVLTLVGCKKNEITKILEGEVKILVNAKDVDVKPTEAPSKAVSSNGFAENSIIGIFTKTEDAEIKDLEVVKDFDFGYKFVSKETYLSPIDQNKKILFEPAKSIALYAYHPYSGSCSNVTVNESGDKYVSYKLQLDQNSQEDLLVNDLMYANCDKVFQSSPIANLKFRHILCKVTFNIYKGINWTVNPVLNKVSISSPNLPIQGRMRLLDGSLSVTKPAESNTVSWTATSNTGLSVGTAASTVELLVLPYAAEGSVFEFELSTGTKFIYAAKAIDFAPATNVRYNVTLNNSQDTPIAINPTIENWVVEQVVEITPN